MYGYGCRYGLRSVTGSGQGAEAMGELFNIDFTTLANLDDFTEVNAGGSSYTLDGGYLKISGAPLSSFGLNALMYDGWVTGLENWVLTMDYIVKDHTTANAGITVTWKMDSSVGATRRDSYVHYRRSGNGARS